MNSTQRAAYMNPDAPSAICDVAREKQRDRLRDEAIERRDIAEAFSANERAMQFLADAILCDDPKLCQRLANGMSMEDAQHIEMLAKDAWRDALESKPSAGGCEL